MSSLFSTTNTITKKQAQQYCLLLNHSIYPLNSTLFLYAIPLLICTPTDQLHSAFDELLTKGLLCQDFISFFTPFLCCFLDFFLCFTTLLRISNTFWIKRFLICRCPSVFEESTLSPSVGCNALRTYISILFSSVYPSPSSSFSLSLFPLFHLNLITQSVVHHTPLPEFYSESEFQPFLNDVFCYLFL